MGVVMFVVAVPADGALPQVIFSNIATSPTSDVPGLPSGTKFHTGTGTQFDRPFGSPDGTRWIFGGVTNLATTEDEIIVVGGGLTGAGAMTVVREGTATFFDGTVNWGTLRTNMGINDAGHYAFSADTSAATTSDEVAARWVGGFELMAREGVQAPGQGAGIGYGSLTNAVHILSNSDVRFRTSSLTGATTQQVLYSNSSLANGTIVAQTDITIPTGQLVAPDQSTDNLTSDRFRSDATGANYIYHGDLNGPTTTDLVMVYNGQVMAQEGVVLPGSGFASNVSSLASDAGSQQVSPYNGHYMFRGWNADGTDWVVRDGAVVAVTDGPIHVGATEFFDDASYTACFFLNAINSFGDYVIGGVTNAADLNANAVLVLNGAEVVLRENDPVDLDGNGLADDNAYISVFNNDDAFLSDDMYYYFNADLRDSDGNSIGQAYLVMLVPEPATLGLLALGVLLVLRRTR